MFMDPFFGRYHNVSYEVVTTTAGCDVFCYGAAATNGTSAIRYLQLFDGLAQPSAGALPIFEVLLPPSGQGSLDPLCFHRIKFSVGIVAACSTTSGSYTAGGSADLSFLVVSFA